MDLKQTFIELCLKYSNNATLIDTYWNEIKNHYTSRQRHYHSLIHLEYIIRELLEIKEQFNNWDAILFSIFYHDIIYKATSKKNEELSAELAKERLLKLGLSNSIIKITFDAIIATKHHKTDSNNDINLFTDADLAILGSNENTYKKYIAAIRKEYSIFPDFLYNKGRKKVLNHFMEMESIYKTNYFKAKYEQQARSNLKMELSSH